MISSSLSLSPLSFLALSFDRGEDAADYPPVIWCFFLSVSSVIFSSFFVMVLVVVLVEQVVAASTGHRAVLVASDTLAGDT